jgi:hypothetical protein
MDATYLLLMLKKKQSRPLAVHAPANFHVPKMSQEAVEAETLIEETIAAVRMSATKLQVGVVPVRWK